MQPAQTHEGNRPAWRDDLSNMVLRYANIRNVAVRRELAVTMENVCTQGWGARTVITTWNGEYCEVEVQTMDAMLDEGEVAYVSWLLTNQYIAEILIKDNRSLTCGEFWDLIEAYTVSIPERYLTFDYIHKCRPKCRNDCEVRGCINPRA